MDIFEAVRARALRAVMNPDGDYVIRCVFRWYSRTFSTPLQEVYDLPLEEILQHYYEVVFEDLSDQDRLEAIDEILKTDEDRKAEQLEEDAKPIETKELLDLAKEMAQYKPKPAIIQGDDDLPPATAIELPPPMPTSAPPPEFSLSFADENLADDNLISDDVENMNSMRQPDEE